MNRPLVKTVVDAIRASTPARRSAFRAEEAQARGSEVRQLRAATRSALFERRAGRRTSASALKRELHEHRAAVIASLHRSLPQSGAASLDHAVLGVIRNHPDGISPLDIGNELGIDWRSLIPVMRHLVDTGAVDQIDHELYPAGTASRTC